MRKSTAMLLAAFILLLAVVPGSAGASSVIRKNGNNTGTNRDYECPIHPTMYSMRRAFTYGRDKNYRDLNADFSAGMIQRQQGVTEYGLYFKFTPGKTDQGYYIDTIDMIGYDPAGNFVYSNSFEADLSCEYGSFYSIEFISLDAMFADMLCDPGFIRKGVYTFEVYFNGLYAGFTQFRVKD